MTVQGELAHPGAEAPETETPDSPRWESRSSEELQSIAHRGVKAGDMFFGAVAEMERRARETEAAHDAERTQEVRTDRRLRWELMILIVVAVAAVLMLAFR